MNQNDFNGTNQFGIGAVSFAFPDVTSPLFNNYSAGNFGKGATDNGPLTTDGSVGKTQITQLAARAG